MNSAWGPKFQIAILADSPDPLGDLSGTDSIEWLFCRQTGDSLFEFYKGETLVSSVNVKQPRFDLPNLLGIIVVGQADTFEVVKSMWAAHLASVLLVFRPVATGKPEAILGAAFSCMAEILRSQRLSSGRAALDLATYRHEFDRLQRSFSRLEQYVGRHSFQRATEIFEYPADSMTVTERTATGLTVTETNRGAHLDDVSCVIGRCLIQDLPVDSCGLSSFSIHISAKPEAEAKPLRIKLKAIETGHILGEWRIDADEVAIGWVELALNSAIDELALSLQAIVEWPSDTSGWALALGPPHPYKEFCAVTETGERFGAPIAMRIFSSLPGVRVPAATTAIRPISAPPVMTKFIPYEVYGTVVQVLPPVQDSQPSLVFYDRDIGCITVHPHSGGLTAARMNIGIPKYAWGISAQIHLAHEQSNPTQFGMMVCHRRDESSELARLNKLDGSSPTFSGWKSLAPLETKSISVLFAAAAEEKLSVYLVTRQAPNCSPDFAWARFNKLEFNVLPRFLSGENESDELAPVDGEPVRKGEEPVMKPQGE